MKSKEKLWEEQGAALRNPLEIICSNPQNNGVVEESLEYTVEGDFFTVLSLLNTTLFVTREYEHLVIALTPLQSKLRQSYLHIPHPSGLVTNKNTKALYIAATRNPNQIWEFYPQRDRLSRKDYKTEVENTAYMVPTRTKLYPGAYYFHDLAIIHNELYANSVGQNGILKVDFTSPQPDPILWQPKSIRENSKEYSQKNYLQLNSIAAGDSIAQSYFSASVEKPGQYCPGDKDFPVNKNGVIFSGKTGNVIARGLTRPHSARLYQGKIWVNNSGYGEVGYIEHKVFKPVFRLNGWTRGLCFIGDYMFVGISRVLPKFYMYAPGLDPAKATTCAIIAINMKRGVVEGMISWPYGNQIFAIDFLPASSTIGFIAQSIPPSQEDEIVGLFYGFAV